jgi:cytidine deaminase
MLTKKDDELIKKAYETIKLVKDTQFGNVIVAHVAAALRTSKGNIYTGVNMECKCDIGSCAEHHAIAEMIKHNEHDIKTIVAVNRLGKIVPPCGRCRELIYQVTHNHKVEIIVPKKKKLLLRNLLPKIWEETYYNPKKK